MTLFNFRSSFVSFGAIISAPDAEPEAEEWARFSICPDDDSTPKEAGNGNAEAWDDGSGVRDAELLISLSLFMMHPLMGSSSSTLFWTNEFSIVLLLLLLLLLLWVVVLVSFLFPPLFASTWFRVLDGSVDVALVEYPMLSGFKMFGESAVFCCCCCWCCCCWCDGQIYLLSEVKRSFRQQCYGSSY